MAEKVQIRFKANPAKTKTVSERDAKILIGLGRWEYQTTAVESGPPARKKRQPKAAPVPEPVPAELELRATPEEEPVPPPAEPTE